MFGGAVVRRAILGIAAAMVFLLPAHARNEADRVADRFAREAERAEARKAEAARKAAGDARRKKQADRKAAQAKKVLEIRKRAEAQRLEAIARIEAERLRVAEEEEMLARARREADEAKAAAETRRLIEEAEAARLHAERLLRPETDEAPDRDSHAAGPSVAQELDRPKQARQRAPEAAVEMAKAAQSGRQAAENTRLTFARAVEHQRRLKSLARVREVRQARLASEARRVAEEREAARLRAEEAARAALVLRAENSRIQIKLARVSRLRRERMVQHARRLEQAAEEERARAAENARLEAQARNDGAERQAAVEQTTSSPAPNASPSTAAPREDPQAERDPPGVAPDTQGERRVTVLMIMTPGTYGIRRGANIADPVLCVIDGCYVSAGVDRSARYMPRRKALGFGNTLGRRAGACRRSLSCIFRDVVLEIPGMVQPVDLHILKHDRRRPQVVVEDSDCGVVAGYLTCNRPLYAEDYVMWIVPERVAALAGPDVLERALDDGLSPSRSAKAFGRAVR